MYIAPYRAGAVEAGRTKRLPFILRLPALAQGRALLLLPESLPESSSPQAVLPAEFFLPGKATGVFAAGTILLSAGEPFFAVTLRLELPMRGRRHSLPCIRLLSLRDIPGGEMSFSACRNGMALAWITVSDRGAAGERRDESGPAVEDMVRAALPLRCASGYLIPDDLFRLRSLVADLALVQGYDLIISSGGTGISGRDLTPEALLPLLEKRLPGFEQAMLLASLQKTPHGAISRAICGVVGESILLTLPGSPKAVRENLLPLLPALPHALDKLQGSAADCGTSD
ncbi:MAG: MogA/MoaB family molybdenum cofactor biosynthesis protein [Deltaproteobacteria bacterium]|jgi:molybdenum cofactor synthesis domain-containing protein|nr:MogA/MoaB family molybdenum cofactor biosynthesis protein [Deltaproteobacteria bacterium]